MTLALNEHVKVDAFCGNLANQEVEINETNYGNRNFQGRRFQA